MAVNSQVSKESVSIIIPTLRRPEHLQRCLASLVHQTLQPAEILAGIRADDDSNDEVIRSFQGSTSGAKGRGEGSWRRRLDELVFAGSKRRLHGAVGRRYRVAAELDRANGCAYPRGSGVYAAGGRDMLQDHPEMRRTEPVTEDVGRFHWFRSHYGESPSRRRKGAES